MVRCSTIIRFLVWLVNRTPSAKNQVANWNKTIQFTLAGEDPFYVTFIDKGMGYHTGTAAATDLEFVSTSKDFFDVITGKARFDQGFSNGAYTIHGSITDAVRLMGVAELTFEAHPVLNKIVRTALGISG